VSDGDVRDPEPTVRLVRWRGPWPDDDPDANFKAEVAQWASSDPMETIENLGANTGIPPGAIVRYVLARWAGAGSEALLHAGPSVINRMWDYCEEAEAAGTDAARLDAYRKLRDVVAWLRLPLED
jgi:Family of unknown function (DUF6027)